MCACHRDLSACWQFLFVLHCHPRSAYARSPVMQSSDQVSALQFIMRSSALKVAIFQAGLWPKIWPGLLLRRPRPNLPAISHLPLRKSVRH